MADEGVFSLGINPTDINALEKLRAKFAETGKTAGLSATHIEALDKALSSVFKYIESIQTVKLPFSKLAQDTEKASAAVKTLQQNYDSYITTVNKAVTSGGFKDQIVDAKALLKAEEMLNVEVEKQASLRAKLATVGVGSKQLVESTKYVSSLKTENTELLKQLSIKEKIISGRAALGQGAYQAQINLEERVAKARLALAQGANQALINSEERLAKARAALGQGAYQAQINLEERVAKARLALAQGANQALINSEERLAKARSALGQGAFVAQDKLIRNQVAALDQLNNRLKSLSKVNLPEAEFKRLKKAIHEVNIELAKTGKSQVVGIAGISREVSSLEGKFKASGKSITNWGKSAKFAIGGVARSMGAMTYSYANLLPLLAGIAIGSIVKDIYKLGAAFEYTTTLINTLDDSVEKLSMQQIGAEILDLEGLTQGPEELAKGMKEFAKAGVGATESLGQIEELAHFAAIAELELSDAIKLVIGQSRAFGITYAQAANTISAAALSSATDINELATALTYTTELATVSGVKFHEVATAMAVMANAGIKSSKAGTAIRTSILKMQNPSEKLKGMLDDLGVSWAAFTEQGQVKNLRAMFTELKKATDNLPEPQRIAVLVELFGLRALKGGANLLKAQGKEWDELSAKIQAANGQLSFVDAKYGALADTVAAKTKILKADFEDFKLSTDWSEWTKTALDDLSAIVDSQLAADLRELTLALLSFAAIGITGVLKAVTNLYDYIKQNPPFISNLVNIVKDIGKLVPDDSTLDKFLKKVGAGYGYIEEKAIAAFKATMDLNKPIPYLYKKSAEYNIPFLPPAGEVPTYGPIKPSDEDIKAMADAAKYQEYLRKSTERLYTELNKKISTEGLSSYQKQLESARVEAEKMITELEKARGDIRLPELEKQKFIDEAVLRRQKKILEEFKKDTEEINFSNFIRSLEESGEVGERVLGKIYTTTKKVMEQARVSGETFFDDLGEEKFTKEAVDRFKAAIKEANILTSIINSLDGKSIQDLRDELTKLAVGTDTAAVAAKVLLEQLEGISVKGLKEVTKSIEDLTFKNTVASLKETSEGMEDWENSANRIKGTLLELKKQAYDFLSIRDQASKDPAGKIQFTDAGKEYFQKLIEGSRAFEIEIKTLKSEIRDLDRDIFKIGLGFQDDLNEVIRSVTGDFSDVDLRVNIKTAVDLKDMDKLKTAVKEAGLEGIKSRQAQYDILVKEAALTRQLALESMQNKKSMYSSDLARIQQLIAAGEEAGQAGSEGRKHQIELLKEALNITKSLDTSADKNVYQAELERAKNEMIKYQDSLTSLKATSQKKYLEVLEKVKRAEAGGADLSKADQQYQTMEKLQQKIVDLMTEEKGGREDQLKAVKKLQEETTKQWQTTEQVAKAAAGQATQYGLILDDNAIKEKKWGDSAVYNAEAALTAINKVIAARKSMRDDPQLYTNTEDDLSGIKVDIVSNNQLEKLREAVKIASEINKFAKEHPGDEAAVDLANRWKEALGNLLEETKTVRKSLKESFDVSTTIDAQKDNINGLKDSIISVTDLSKTLKDTEAAHAKVIDINTGKMVEWSTKSVKAVDKVNDSFKELVKTINSIPTKTTSAGVEGRASGGPVSANTPYIVGEKRPELFVPRTAGNIIPYVPSSKSQSRDIVDINLSINGSEPVTVQGDRMTVDKLQRAFKEQKRFAA